jgi:2-polyprenyl-3-methyl-5-hydroxy-6-metoxy-1,4-benzoquinol methylase
MLIKKSFEDPAHTFSCPVCETGVRSVRYVYTQHDFEHKIYRCNSCHFLFARPLFIPKLEERQMDAVGNAEMFNNTFLQYLYENLIIKREISSVRKIMGKGSLSVLDIGCGTGWTSNIWKKSDFEVTGVEPSRTRGTRAAEKYGIRIFFDYLENLEIQEKFDVITLRHVIEHFEEPHAMVGRTRAFLKKGGVLLVVVPNIDSIGRYIFGTKWSWILPLHCNFFNPKSLKRLLARCGYHSLKSYQTPSPVFYPESFLSLLSESKKVSSRVYRKLSVLSLAPFFPVVMLGYFLRMSENVTIIAKAENV